MLNKINQQEQKHSEMFKKINEKLSDHRFVQATIQNNAISMNKNQIKETINYKKQSKMTAKDGKCYKERYSDIGDMTPFKHFVTVGRDQGRLSTCARNLTDFELQYYMRSFPDLQHSFGIEFYTKKTQQRARNHFLQKGFQEKR